MTATTVSARVQQDDADDITGEVTYDFGETLAEAVTLFGEDVVFKRFVAAARVDLQGAMRRHMTAEKPLKGKALQTAIDEWKPGVQKPRKSKQEKALELLSGMSAEERAAFLDEVQAA